MAIYIIILLGIVQGASEFLPISSSGHLVVFYNAFNITDNVLFLSVILHLGTLLAVLIVYKNSIISLAKKPFNKTNISLLISTIITVIMVLLFKQFIVDSFDGRNIELFFLITAATLLIAQFVSEKKDKNILQTNLTENNKTASINESSTLNDGALSINITYLQAALIGFAQGLATVPGISRSGLTISMALIVGVNKNDAPTYSFLMSIPIILASLFYEVSSIIEQGAVVSYGFLELLIGFLVAFLVGFLCLKLMINFVKQQKLYIFSIYLAVLVLFLTLNKHFFHLF